MKIRLTLLLILGFLGILYVSLAQENTVTAQQTATSIPEIVEYEEVLRIDMDTINQVTNLAWSPDGRFIATGHNIGQIMIWDATEAKPAVHALEELSDSVASLDWCSSGIIAATDGQNTFVWDAEKYELIHDFTGGNQLVCDPNGTWLAIQNARWESIEIWEIETWEMISVLGNPPIYTFAVNSDGSQLATSTNGIDVYDIATGNITLEIEDDGYLSATRSYLSWKPDGSQVISSGPSFTEGIVPAAFWNALTGDLEDTHPTSYPVDWQPHGKLIAGIEAIDNESYMFIVDASTGNQVEIQDNLPGILLVAWRPDGLQIASASSDHTIRIWQEQ